MDDKNRSNSEDENNSGSQFEGETRDRYGHIKAFLIILFILTLACMFFALMSYNYANGIKPQHGFNFVKNAWVFWCWLPVPILSIILGFKYKKAGLKCRKNIIGGFIIAGFLLVYGAFSFFPTFEQDYSKIDAYRSFIKAELPETGELEIQEWGRYFDDDKTEYVVVNAYYDKEDVESLERSITDSSEWVPCNQIKSKLRALIPSTLKTDSDAYFSIYNKTTGEYNSLPDKSGTYEIYAMKYDKSDKQLEIHRFIVEFNA